LIKFLDCLANFFVFAQACFLGGCTAMLFAMTQVIQTKNPEASNYCDYSLVVYATFLMTVTWIFMAVAAVIYLYVRCVAENAIKRTNVR